MRRKLSVTLIVTVLGTFLALGGNLLAGNTPNLGLDLQGGASVTLVPEGDYESGAIDVAVEIIRSRVDSLGVAEPEIVRQGDTVVVNLPGVTDQQRAIDLVSVTGQVLLRPVLQFFPGAGLEDVGDEPQDGDIQPTEGEEPESQDGPPRALPDDEAQGDETPAEDEAPVDSEAPVEGEAPLDPVDGVPDDGDLAEPDPNNPFAQVIVEDSDGNFYVLGPAFPDQLGGFASGEFFQNDASADIFDGQWTVVVGLRPGIEGRDRWNAAATQCFNRSEVCPSGQMAIVLDGEVISAPVVQTPVFDNVVSITGNFRESEARDLAKILEFGAIPVQFEDATAQSVSASLGQDTLQAAIIAGLVGVLLVLAYLFVYYRMMTLVVVAGVVLFGMVMWSAISFLSATRGLALTLAGATGIIVSIGMMVDSYILIFERLKDELRIGRTLRNATQRGFENAWKTIVIANVVSLLGAFILWYLTVGSVRGFAFFLGLATLCNVLVAYFFARPALLLLGRSRWMQGRTVLGLRGLAEPTTGGAGT